jgi:hypothetical protein
MFSLEATAPGRERRPRRPPARGSGPDLGEDLRDNGPHGVLIKPKATGYPLDVVPLTQEPEHVHTRRRTPRRALARTRRQRSAGAAAGADGSRGTSGLSRGAGVAVGPRPLCGATLAFHPCERVARRRRRHAAIRSGGSGRHSGSSLGGSSGRSGSQCQAAALVGP